MIIIKAVKEIPEKGFVNSSIDTGGSGHPKSMLEFSIGTLEIYNGLSQSRLEVLVTENL